MRPFVYKYVRKERSVEPMSTYCGSFIEMPFAFATSVNRSSAVCGLFFKIFIMQVIVCSTAISFISAVSSILATASP